MYTNANADGASPAHMYRKDDVIAGQVVRQLYKVNAGTGRWDNRWLEATPIRVG
jgi:hypothetical protein